MPPNNTATTLAIGVAGRVATPKAKRTQTFTSLLRRATGQEQSPEIETIEVFIPKYNLDWDRLKVWLDKRFERYNSTFTERYRVVRS
jgi:hypothetical protein